MPPTSDRPKLTLPSELSDGRQEWRRTRIVIIGAGGIGKSGLMANGGMGTLFADSEGNLGHLKVKRVPCRNIDEMFDMVNALQEAQAKGDYPFDTTVCDTIDKIVESIDDAVVAWAKKKFPRVADSINSVGDVPNGAGWSELSKRTMSFLDCLDALPSATVVITHPKMTKVESASAASYDKETVSLFPSIANRLLAWSHHNLHVQSRWKGSEFKRIVKTLPEAGTEGKSHGGLIPNDWEWKTRDLADEYKFLRSLFI